MKEVKIVVGANFGDEGKGLMTDYFAEDANRHGKSCLVVLHNGGCQRGHTVSSTMGLRHVFHHFGSGMCTGASTYFAKDFLVNPAMFMKEIGTLLGETERGLGSHMVNSCINKEKCFVDVDCKLTLPYDMMINQYVETKRNGGRHGSCGMGIFETEMRNKTSLCLTFGRFAKLDTDEKFEFLDSVRTNYVIKRLKELGYTDLDDNLKDLLTNDNIIRNYIADFGNMQKCTTMIEQPWKVFTKFDTVIFEGGQGLLLDQNNREYMPHLTPSNTGIQNPMSYLKGINGVDIEVCYVTRTYLTRHGAGRFDTECNVSEINPEIKDLTNVPNEFQETIRYGKMDLKEFNRRISHDFYEHNIFPNTKISVAVTYANMTDGRFIEANGSNHKIEECFVGYIDTVYIAEGEMSCYVKKVTEEGVSYAWK